MTWLLSPKYTADKVASRNLDDIVDVYEDQVRSWVLEPSQEMLKQDKLPTAMNLLAPYFEERTSLRTGRASVGKSKQFFVEGFCDMFATSTVITDAGTVVPSPFLKEAAKAVYQNVRCSFAHTLSFGTHTILAPDVFDGPLYFTTDSTGKVETVVVNVPSLLQNIEHDFGKYLSRLRDPQETQIRSAFETEFWRRQPKGPLQLTSSLFTKLGITPP